MHRHIVVMASHAFASRHAVVARGGALMNNKNNNNNNNGRRKFATVAGVIRRGEQPVDITSTDQIVATPIDVSASIVPRRGALVGAAAAALSVFVAPAGPALAGNPLESFAEGQLASKGKLFMVRFLYKERLQSLYTGEE